MSRTITLTEYKPYELGRGALRDADAGAVWERYQSRISIESPGPANGWRWRLLPHGWIGYFPVSDELTLIVEPKVPLRSIFGMWEWAYDLRQFKVLDGQYQAQSLEEFYSQLARILAQRVLDRGRAGLAREYVGYDEPLSFVRGRLDLPAQIRQPWATHPRCHYHEHTADVPDNQLLAWTLSIILRGAACNERVRPVARQAFMMLRHAVDLRPFTARESVGRRYTRLTQDYSPMHALCRFFLEHSGPSHTEGERAMLPFIVGTAELFELFVAKWLAARLPEAYRLRAQENINILPSGEIRYLIDLVIEERLTGRVLAVLDTKYKDVVLPSNPDINQVVAYAEATGCARAGLVYPGNGAMPYPFSVGRIKVTPLVFDLSGDLEAGGQAFLGQLMAMLGA